MAEILPLIFGRIYGKIDGREVIIMESSYKELYFALFRALGRAVTAFDAGDVFTARTVLISALQAAEEVHLETDILKEQS